MHNQDDNDAWDRAIDRKASAMRVLAPLGFEDADDGELPGAIWHRNAAITHLPLGMDFDRAEWVRMQRLWQAPNAVLTGLP